MQILNTLYVTVPDSYLRLENDTLRVEVEKEIKLRVPLHHLGSVVCRSKARHCLSARGVDRRGGW